MKIKLHQVFIMLLSTIIFVIGGVKPAMATTNTYEEKLQSIINKHGEEKIVVGNGVSIELGSSVDLNVYLEDKEIEWVTFENDIITIENNMLYANNKGTTFIWTNSDEKIQVLEILVTDSNTGLYTLEPKNTVVDRTYYKVFIDPGHGGVDPGAVANGAKESHINLSISLKVKNKLENKGVEVKMSRTSDTTVDLYERAKMANAYGADAFVSIHQNSYSSQSVNGIETYYHNDKPQHRDYTTRIQNSLIKNTNAYNRGVKTANFVVNRETTMPSALVEGGFITNTNEVNKLLSDSYQDSIATAISDSVYKYLQDNVAFKPVNHGELNAFVTSVYRLALNREPDQNGFKYWTERLAARDFTGRYILRNLLNEPEFKNMNLSSEQFISKMYHIIANREAEPAGLRYWIDRYDELIRLGNGQGAARLQILEFMIGEPEFKNRCSYIGILY